MESTTPQFANCWRCCFSNGSCTFYRWIGCWGNLADACAHYFGRFGIMAMPDRRAFADSLVWVKSEVSNGLFTDDRIYVRGGIWPCCSCGSLHLWKAARNVLSVLFERYAFWNRVKPCGMLLSYLRGDQVRRPAHRDKAAMNGAQLPQIPKRIFRIDEKVTCQILKRT